MRRAKGNVLFTSVVTSLQLANTHILTHTHIQCIYVLPTAVAYRLARNLTDCRLQISDNTPFIDQATNVSDLCSKLCLLLCPRISHNSSGKLVANHVKSWPSKRTVLTPEMQKQLDKYDNNTLIKSAETSFVRTKIQRVSNWLICQSMEISASEKDNEKQWAAVAYPGLYLKD
jgi:hypothetical protein